MSVESAKTFLKRLKDDESFALQLLHCPDSPSRLLFVQKSGFDFDAGEIQKAVLELQPSELTSEELDRISGGFPLPDNVDDLVKKSLEIINEMRRLQQAIHSLQ